MAKFPFVPLSDGYSFSDTAEAVSVTLDGGMSRTRRDILNATKILNLSWALTSDQYEIFRMFYRSNSAGGYGATPFTIDLFVEGTIEEHTARFVPGSVQFQGIDAPLNRYKVSAQVEVIPNTLSEGMMEIIIALWDLLGSKEAILEYLNALEYLVNTRLPAIGVPYE